MFKRSLNKKKIINDPVYGFVNIHYDIIYDIIKHPYFQRLRHIKQLGLTAYVYPGALHTRFHHALGATHLMKQAIEVLRSKNVAISSTEAQAVTIAILMHDIGHGPFSHALEHSLASHISHEDISLLFMQRLNDVFGGQLDLAIAIFRGEYHKTFLHDLVSSQLDMDRLDYINRDSFFTGVQEGSIGDARIIKMLNVENNNLAIEYKGIYSVEQFLIARRLMYWQVYLHRTVISAEMMLLKILQRARELTQLGKMIYSVPALQTFLKHDYTLSDFENDSSILEQFAKLTDADVFVSIKEWQYDSDFVLSYLAKGIVNRQLLKIDLQNKKIEHHIFENMSQSLQKKYSLTAHESSYLVFCDSTSNSAYSYEGSQINILYKNGNLENVATASDYLNISSLAQPVVKHYICFPEELCTF